MCYATSCGERCSIAGCSTLGCGATLGGVAFGVIVEFGGSLGVGTRPGSSNTSLNVYGSVTGTLSVYFGGAIGGVHGWFS